MTTLKVLLFAASVSVISVGMTIAIDPDLMSAIEAFILVISLGALILSIVAYDESQRKQG